jgi:large subunit ribosomal protein L10
MARDLFFKEVTHLANVQNIEAKAAQVAEIQAKLAKAQSVAIFDYRGLTVEEVSNLRNDMRAAGIEYVVLKNSMVERAAKQGGIDEAINDYLKGPSAFAFGYDDPVAPAKLLKETVRKLRKCEVKGGLINGVVSNAAAFDTLADLPPREVLIARLLGSMLSPLSGLAIALDQIAKKGGAAPAAE